MYMERFLMEKLVEWKQSEFRKPLILKGARQVGKTWLLEEFGRRHYENTVIFNFDENEEYKQFFEMTKEPGRLIANLSIAAGKKITPGDTLLIFDEIQECPEAINSLKYFCEKAPAYHVACAGSLLGISLAKDISYPVGKVNFLELGPMTFTEFLAASGDDPYVGYLNSLTELSPLPDAFMNPLIEKLKMYFITGGMPEAVYAWTQRQDPALVQQILFEILGTYERDFGKHPEKKDIPKIRLIWESLPSQLSRENKKFLYRAVKNGARAREYEDALQWLIDAGLLYKIFRTSKPGIPVSAYDDLSAFKIYLLDVGLLRRLSNLAPSAFAEGNRLFEEFKGALTENYVLQSLLRQFESTPRYWVIENPRHEVDFLIQRGNDIFPIEVKSSTNVESRSLKAYKSKYNDRTRLRIRYPLNNLCLDGDVLNIPLFMADQTDRLIGLALEKAQLHRV